MRLGRLPLRCLVLVPPATTPRLLPPSRLSARSACPPFSSSPRRRRLAHTMASSPPTTTTTAGAADTAAPRFRFGPFDVSTQVFYTTARSFALVNLKPLLPGHVLVCPRRPCARLTDLAPDELADLFRAVQVVQRMLALYYFRDKDHHSSGGQPADGSFNLAVQDGPEAGQTVPHVHVHVLPRIRGATAKDAASEGDALYEAMADEPGNVGGAQWDRAREEEAQSETTPRPVPGGRFPAIEDSQRRARSMAEMEAEAAQFRSVLARMGEAVDTEGEEGTRK